MATTLFYILIFPGFLFLGAFGLVLEFADRRLYARFQNRQGPPWFQPFADFIKLASKESIIPDEANKLLFVLMPVVAVASVLTSFFYIPLWSVNAIYSFDADLIVVVYLLTIPTLTFFLGGWFSTSLFSMIGSLRTLTQLFAYEVPLFLALLAPALVAGSWRISEITAFYNDRPALLLFNIVGFVVAIVALLGKLEKVPFDIPEAETEIVGGTFTEYSGRYLALFRMAIDMEMVVGATLLAAIFLPFGLGLPPVVGFVLYVVKVFFIIALLALARSLFARLRIDQMVDFCWKYVAPLAILQLVISLVVKGVLGS